MASLTCAASSIEVRWRPSLGAVIVTHLVTQPCECMVVGLSRSALLLSTQDQVCIKPGELHSLARLLHFCAAHGGSASSARQVRGTLVNLARIWHITVLTRSAAYLLIRRDLRGLPAPAHMPGNLGQYCSAMRNDRHSYAALYGQNQASIARWPSRPGRSATVKQQLTPRAGRGLLLPASAP